jgi:hypothetical protein
MHGVRIRLWGIDAPESSQLCRGEDSLQYHCGAQAANELDAFIDRRPINCVPVSLDPYGRTVATCSVAGRDLGEWLVQNGLALDWPNTRRAGITKLSARLSAPARESGRAATSSRGSFVHIYAQAESRRLFGRCKCPSLSDPSKAPIHNVRWPGHHTWASGSGAFWATHATHHSQLPHCGMNEMVAATPELPASGYALEVDGRLKAEFITRDGARAGGEELKKRFPMLQIRIYDAQTNAREEI